MGRPRVDSPTRDPNVRGATIMKLDKIQMMCQPCNQEKADD